jgi:RluA family pseudouridine synthase
MRLDASAGTAQLRDVVQAWLERELGRPISRATVRRLIMAGVVTVDGRAVAVPGRQVPAGARLEARVDLARLPPSHDDARPGPLIVLYEDDDLVAVDKPPGLPTVPTADARRPSVVSVLKGQFARRAGIPAEAVYLGVHQRLDVETSGVVVFTKRPQANQALAHAFGTHAARKCYLALTARPTALPPMRWTVDRPANQSQAPGASGVEPRAAVTEFTVTEVLAQALIVEARPLTGRKHQVRIHLASCGLPILGDASYGGPSRVGRALVPRVMLHAARLEIVKPATGAPLVIEAPTPRDFEEMIAALATCD